jgi:hypothetical protein
MLWVLYLQQQLNWLTPRGATPMNNQPAVTHHPKTIIPPIGPSGSEAPARSTLAHILEAMHHTKRVGYAFHVMSNGRLVRRGIVLDESPSSLIVSYCDVFGMPHEVKKISKARVASWKWFVDVEHSNVVYDKLFGVQ